MHTIYPLNNLPFWSEADIEQRQFLSERFHHQFERAMRARNRAWLFERIEAPMMIDRAMLNAEYDDDMLFTIAPKMHTVRTAFLDAVKANVALWSRVLPDAPAVPEVTRRWCENTATLDDWPQWLDAWAVAWWKTQPQAVALALRPETTPATYAWMEQRVHREAAVLPYCCWQLNKSFRREQDQPSKHMRLKEFYQQEFQCVYSSDSHEDWHAFVVEPVKHIIAELTRCPARVVVSDRLPAYSVSTIDVEVWNADKWMEICSISKRIDFPDVVLKAKANTVREALVCEVATSPDRQWYCLQRSQDAWDTVPRHEYRDDNWQAACVTNEETAQRRLARR